LTVNSPKNFGNRTISGAQIRTAATTFQPQIDNHGSNMDT